MLPDLLRPGLRVVIAGTVSQRHRAEREHYYAGPGNKFWVLLHESGLVPRLIDPADDAALLGYGIGLTDLVFHPQDADPPSVADRAGFEQALLAVGAPALAFVSKTAAYSYARVAGQRLPRGYGAPSWTVAGIPAFVLPGPSGANNGMPLPLRIALWRDLADFLQSL